MRRSLPPVAILCLSLALAAHAQDLQLSNPRHLASQSQGLEAGPEVATYARIALPSGFTPSAAPIWLGGTSELMLRGSQDGHSTALGFSGAHFNKRRLLAADLGPGASDGSILALAPSLDSTSLALAVATGSGKLEVNLRELTGDNNERTLGTISGRFANASLSWLGPDSLALGLGPALEGEPGAPEPAENDNGTNGAPQPSGLYTIGTLGIGEPARVKLGCNGAADFSHLSWSVNGRYAIGLESNGRAPSLINREAGRCQQLNLADLHYVQFLAWAKSGDRFLYIATPTGADVPEASGIFEYNVNSGENRLVAAPSGSAGYLPNGQIVVLGNRKLTSRSVLEHPSSLVAAELALITQTGPEHAEVTVAPLGIGTAAGMLVRGEMAIAAGANALVVKLFVPAPGGEEEALFYFNGATRKVGLLATLRGGTMRASLEPDGDLIAIISTTAAGVELLVLGRPG